MINNILYLLKKNASAFTAIVFMLFFYETSFCQVQIDSLKTTISTCPNNGSIVVYAKGINLPLLYSIIAGPLTQPVQTGNIFNSIPPGNYTVRVSDGLGNNTSQNAVITGNYISPDFNPIKTNPYCAKEKNGKLIGNRTAGTGKEPFTWQLIAPSPVTTAPQASDTFNNLPEGNYTMRLTDACGSYRTIVATLSDPNTKFGFYGMPPLIEIIGCDSAWVTSVLQFSPSVVRLPLSYKYQTKNGTYTTTTPTKIDTSSIRSSGIVRVEQLLKNITYGDKVRVSIYNACGDSIWSLNTIDPFTFYPKYSYNSCGTMATAQYNYVKDATFYYGLNAPITYIYVNVATNAVVDSRTITGDLSHYYPNMIYGINITPALPIGNTYKLTIKDGCGKTFQQNYTIPAQATPKIVGKGIIQVGCLDSSAGTYRIQVTGFTTNPKLILLSGPATLGSTKPDFAYKDTYTYPDTSAVGYAGQYFFLENLGIGTYQYKVIDECGNEIFDSFVIKPTDNITSLYKNISYKKGCLGQNKIYYSMSKATVTIKNISTGVILKNKEYFNNSNSDSAVNVPSGQYEVTFQFEPGSYGDNYINNTYHYCWNLKDTINIEGYQTPEIFTANSVKCKSNSNIVLIPDSSKGVPPYQYEIISGPQTFTVQNSNLFSVNASGVYNARIYDICGNASTKQFFIDTISIPFIPVQSQRSCDKLRIVYPSSSFYTYKWRRPDNTIFTSDSLVIDQITAADTGMYFISRIININGCKDTLHSSYHVSLNNFYRQKITICNGSVISVGAHSYNTTGIYTDTLTSISGCDSIVQLNLIVINYKYHSITRSVCPGESIVIGGHTYTRPGIYHDTLATTTCDSIVTLNLSFSPAPTVYLGKDTSLCQGQTLTLDAGSGYATYYWNNNFLDSTLQTKTVNTKSKYWVSIKNKYGCTNTDTIEILDIHSLPVAAAGRDTAICSSESIQLSASGGDNYKWFPGGETEATIRVSPTLTTHYTVIVNDIHNCGSSADEVIVYIKHPSSKPVFDNNYMQHCFDEGPSTISAGWGNSFLWSSTGETTQSITINQGGLYSVTIWDDAGCPVTGQITVNEYCAPEIFVPDAFSPNNDGQNDDLEIFGRNFKKFKITIFNRWGEIIFISTDRNKRWNGIYREAEMPIGTYPWIITYQNEYNDKNEYILKGSITLIR